MRVLLFAFLVAGCGAVTIDYEPADLSQTDPRYCTPGWCGDPHQPCCCDGGVPYCAYLRQSDGGLVDDACQSNGGCAGPVGAWK